MTQTPRRKATQMAKSKTTTSKRVTVRAQAGTSPGFGTTAKFATEGRAVARCSKCDFLAEGPEEWVRSEASAHRKVACK